MKDKIFLAVHRSGVTRMTKRWPALSRDEIGVAISLDIPDSAFRSPIVNVSLDVPEDHVTQPEINMTVDEPPTEDPHD